MTTITLDPSRDEFTKRLIQRTAWQLAQCPGFRGQDQKDLKQELCLHVLERLPAFDAEKGHLRAFIRTVVKRKAQNLARDARAQKRAARHVRSLNVMASDEDGRPTELGDTLGEFALDKRLGRYQRSAQESVDLAIDLECMTATLPERWRELLERRKTGTIDEASRAMNVPWRTLYCWLERIREHCGAMGIAGYL